jgi:hypothetical protein
MMKSHRLVGWGALAAMCLMLTSCIDSETPLCEPDKTKADDELAGLWRTKLDDGTVEYYHVALAGDKFPESVFRIVAIIHTKKGTLSPPMELLAYPTVVGKNRYLNVAVVNSANIAHMAKTGWDRANVKGYFIVKYELNGDSLALYTMDRDAKRAAIESDAIMGKTGDQPVFTDVAPKLIELLMSPQQNAKLYGNKPRTFERIK